MRAWGKCTDQGKRQVDVLSSGILSVTKEIIHGLLTSQWLHQSPSTSRSSFQRSGSEP